MDSEDIDELEADEGDDNGGLAATGGSATTGAICGWP